MVWFLVSSRGGRRTLEDQLSWRSRPWCHVKELSRERQYLLGTERLEPTRARLDRKLGGMAGLRGVRSRLRTLIGVLGLNDGTVPMGEVD